MYVLSKKGILGVVCYNCTQMLLIGRSAFPDPVANGQWNAGGHRRVGPGQLQHHSYRPTLKRQHSSAKGAHWDQSIQDSHQDLFVISGFLLISTVF